MKEFKNSILFFFSDFCNKCGISYEFSSLKTLQQNCVVERKNRTLQERAHVMSNSKKLSKRLWAEAMNTTCYMINRVYFCPGTKKTPYELWKYKKPNVSYFHIFCSICYILKDREHLGKFYSKSDTDVFLGYSTNSKTYRVYNMITQTIMESIIVVINDSCDFSEFSKEETISSLIEEVGDETATNQLVATPSKIGSGPSKSVATTATPKTGTVKLIATELYRKWILGNPNVSLWMFWLILSEKNHYLGSRKIILQI